MISETRFVSGLHVESVFSEDPENAKKFCDTFELDSWHDSMDSFLDCVDLVYIHTPISDAICLRPPGFDEEKICHL